LQPDGPTRRGGLFGGVWVGKKKRNGSKRPIGKKRSKNHQFSVTKGGAVPGREKGKERGEGSECKRKQKGGSDSKFSGRWKRKFAIFAKTKKGGKKKKRCHILRERIWRNPKIRYEGRERID